MEYKLHRDHDKEKRMVDELPEKLKEELDSNMKCLHNQLNTTSTSDSVHVNYFNFRFNHSYETTG
jgi:hypothetical protein